MPAYTGILTFSASDSNGMTADQLRRFAHLATKHDDAEPLTNPNSLPRDPISAAISAAMGLSQVAITHLAGNYIGSLYINFVPDAESGASTLNLPETHPALHDDGADRGRLMRVGNDKVTIQMDRNFEWDSYYEDTDTCDTKLKGFFQFTREIPETLSSAYQSRAAEGALDLSDIMDIPALRHLAIPITDFDVVGNIVQVIVDMEKVKKRPS